MVLRMKRWGKIVFAGLTVLLLMTATLLPSLAETDTADGGDLLLFDSEATVKDEVGGDLLAFVMDLTVKGEVQGSIRACANNLLLDSPVGRNVTVAGSIIGCNDQFDAKDVKIVGTQVVFLGACDTLSVYGGTVYIGGTVRGELVCEADQVVLLEGAEIASARISSPSEPLVAKSLSDTSYSYFTGSSFQEVVKFTKQRSAFVSDLINLPITLLVAVVLALVMTLLLKRMPERVPQRFKARSLSFCMRGFAAILLIPIVAVLLLLPMVTWPISLSLFLLYGVLLLVADAIAAVVLSRAWMARRNPYLSAALIAAILAVLSILPFVGWLVSLFGATVGFGAVVSLVFTRREPIVNERPEMDFRV